MSASLKDVHDNAFLSDEEEEDDDEPEGETMLEQARKQAAAERQVAQDISTHDIKAEVGRLKARLIDNLGRKDFESAYRVVSAADDNDDDVDIDFGAEIGMDRLYLLPTFQNLKALEEELARRY